jgi:hypothetical protein
MSTPIVGIHDDRQDWGQVYATICGRLGVEYQLFDMLSDRWLDACASSSVVFFKCTMYPDNIRILKERQHLLKYHLDRATFPNVEAFWHFNSKAVQRDLFELAGMRHPKTMVLGAPEDVASVEERFPAQFVWKDSGGAGSSRVGMSKNTPISRLLLRSALLDSIPYRLQNVAARRVGFFPAGGGQKIAQEFIDGCEHDIRVTTVGTEYAYVFRRRNRKDDFRASGSGMLEYEWQDGYWEAMTLCLEMSRKMSFSNMAYDLIRTPAGEVYCVEFSCFYDEGALLRCPNVFRIDGAGNFTKIPKVSPLELHLRSHLQLK